MDQSKNDMDQANQAPEMSETSQTSESVTMDSSTEQSASRSDTSSMHYAGFWRRFGAYLIDAIILWIISGLVSALLGPEGFDLGTDTDVFSFSVEAQLPLFIIGLIYYVFFNVSDMQATPGKKAFGMKVKAENGERLTYTKAIIRYLSKIISGAILMLGYIMAAFTKKKQALHDIFAGTVVVREE